MTMVVWMAISSGCSEGNSETNSTSVPALRSENNMSDSNDLTIKAGKVIEVGWKAAFWRWFEVKNGVVEARFGVCASGVRSSAFNAFLVDLSLILINLYFFDGKTLGFSLLPFRVV